MSGEKQDPPDDLEFVPLLAKKSIWSYTAEDFRLAVIALYTKREPRKGTPKKKRLRDYKVLARILKGKGNVSIKTKRDPKYVTEEEFREICKTLGRAENEVYVALRESGIRVTTHEEAEQIRSESERLAAGGNP